MGSENTFHLGISGGAQPPSAPPPPPPPDRSKERFLRNGLFSASIPIMGTCPSFRGGIDCGFKIQPLPKTSSMQIASLQGTCPHFGFIS